MTIQVQETPNPNARKFTTESMIFKGEGSVSVMPGQTSEYDIMNDLMKLEGVDNVFGFQNFITVNKLPNTEWDDLTPQVKEIISGYGY